MDWNNVAPTHKIRRPFHFLPGSKVMIRKWAEKPKGWNSEMFHKLRGSVCTIKEIGSGSHKSYKYQMAENSWLWRHIDLISLKAPDIDPNFSFKMRKHGYR